MSTEVYPFPELPLDRFVPENEVPYNEFIKLFIPEDPGCFSTLEGYFMLGFCGDRNHKTNKWVNFKILVRNPIGKEIWTSIKDLDDFFDRIFKTPQMEVKTCE